MEELLNNPIINCICGFLLIVFIMFIASIPEIFSKWAPHPISQFEMDDIAREQMEEQGMSDEEIDEILYGDK